MSETEIEQRSDTSGATEIVDVDDANDAEPVHKTETIEVIDVTPPAKRPSRFANIVTHGLTLLSQAMRLAIDILETKRTQQIQPTEDRRAPVHPVTSTRNQPVKPDVTPSSPAPRGGSGRRRRQRSGRGRRRR